MIATACLGLVTTLPFLEPEWSLPALNLGITAELGTVYLVYFCHLISILNKSIDSEYEFLSVLFSGADVKVFLEPIDSTLQIVAPIHVSHMLQ